MSLVIKGSPGTVKKQTTNHTQTHSKTKRVHLLPQWKKVGLEMYEKWA